MLLTNRIEYKHNVHRFTMWWWITGSCTNIRRSIKRVTHVCNSYYASFISDNTSYIFVHNTTRESWIKVKILVCSWCPAIFSKITMSYMRVSIFPPDIPCFASCVLFSECKTCITNIYLYCGSFGVLSSLYLASEAEMHMSPMIGNGWVFT